MKTLTLAAALLVMIAGSTFAIAAQDTGAPYHPRQTQIQERTSAVAPEAFESQPGNTATPRYVEHSGNHWYRLFMPWCWGHSYRASRGYWEERGYDGPRGYGCRGGCR